MSHDARSGQLRAVANNPYGINVSDLTSFVRAYYPNGVPGGDVFDRPLSLGDIDNTQGDRELYGSLFIDYAVRKAIDAQDIPPDHASVLIARGDLAKAALMRKLEQRRVGKEAMAAYRVDAEVNLKEAASRRASDTLLDTALTTKEMLGGHTAATVAADAASALGYIARQGLTIQTIEEDVSVQPEPPTNAYPTEDYGGEQTISV